MHSAVVDVPRAFAVTAVSRALVAVAVRPLHVVAAPAQLTSATASEVDTGPDTSATPVAGSFAVAAAGRSSTRVCVPVEQAPPAPCVVHWEVALLSRTPLMSPLAPPEVPEPALPVHRAVAHSADDAASLAAARVRPVLPTWESLEPEQSPAFVVQLALAFVVRTAVTAVVFFAAAFVPAAVTRVPGAAMRPVVAMAAVPVQRAAEQSTHASAEETAPPSASAVRAGTVFVLPVVGSIVVRAARVSVAFSAVVPDAAPHRPAFTVQSALPEPSRVVATPSADDAVAVAPRPVPSTSTVASERPSSPSTAAEPECAAQPPAVNAQSVVAVVSRVRAFGSAAFAPALVAPAFTTAGVTVWEPFVDVSALPVQPVAPSAQRA